MSLRQGATRRRRVEDIFQKTWRQLVNPFPAARLISDDEVESIYLAGLDILERIGIRCQVGEARDVFVRFGATVDESDGRVRVGREIVEAALTTIPNEITLMPRNPDHAVSLGGRLPDDGCGFGAAKLH